MSFTVSSHGELVSGTGGASGRGKYASCEERRAKLRDNVNVSQELAAGRWGAGGGEVFLTTRSTSGGVGGGGRWTRGGDERTVGETLFKTIRRERAEVPF